MEKIELSKDLVLELENHQEVMGIAGPWVANMYINNEPLEGQFSVNPPVMSENKEYLILGKFFEGKFLKKSYFRIFLLNINTKVKYLSKQKYRALYIEHMKENVIEFYQADHNKKAEYKDSIIFDDHNFSAV